MNKFIKSFKQFLDEDRRSQSKRSGADHRVEYQGTDKRKAKEDRRK